MLLIALALPKLMLGGVVQLFRSGWVVVVAFGALAALDASLLLQYARLNRTSNAGSFSLAPPVGRGAPPLDGIDNTAKPMTTAPGKTSA